ncbi:protein kinase domain-containing protein [Pendulispora albinea]|uniref:Protein kinase n=1 Tax=Pendulispora albinea TaxID=2741071 RepID=A0ABZ2M8P5_9BACT
MLYSASLGDLVVEENRAYGRAGRIGKVIRGKWRIDARLGEGATATVYAATHRNGHRVALKVLHPQFLRDEQIRTRFMREAYVGNAISHPGVVRVIDDDVTEDGAVFLVMELLEGESFEKRAERHGGRLPLAEVVWLLDTLLDVLAAAHERSVVHRDVKPENLFLTRDGRIKVLDFGFARMKEQAERGGSTEAATSLTKTGFILGTPDFMSPEQAGGRNSAVDGRSDLWSAAATAFCLISGQRVHPGAVTLHQHLLQTATARARSLGSVDPGLPASLVAVIDRALSLEPERRWSDAHAMRTALRAAVGSVAKPKTIFDDAQRLEQLQRMELDSEPDETLRSDLEATVVVDSSRLPPVHALPFDARHDESVIFVSTLEPQSGYDMAPAASGGARGAMSPPAGGAPPDTERMLRHDSAPEPRHPRPVHTPRPAGLGMEGRAPQALDPRQAADLGPGNRPPQAVDPRAPMPSESSRSGITAPRIRPSSFDRYFSRWIFFLVIATIAAIIYIIGLQRKRHMSARRSNAAQAQPVERAYTVPPGSATASTATSQAPQAPQGSQAAPPPQATTPAQRR